MQDHRFDAIARSLAGGASRRRFMGWVGRAGAALGLAGAGATRATPASGAAAQRDTADHYECYVAAPSEPFEPRDVVLADQFGEAKVRILSPDEFCTPVSKNGEPITDKDTHWTCYPIEDPQPTRLPQVIADNQFGTLRLRLRRRGHLCVPSKKTIPPPPPTPTVAVTPTPTATATATPTATTEPTATPTPAPPKANHFRCYRVATDPVEPVGVTLKDQFESEEVRLGTPEVLCAPVDKNEEGMADPAVHLLAYPFEAGPYAPRVATLDNQFGTFKLRFERAGWLFVPSQKLAVDGNPVDLPFRRADHYKAYPGEADRFGPLAVTLKDQFDSGQAAVGTPDLLLAPVSKNEEGIVDEATHYLGYPFVEPAQGPTPVVELANQFGGLKVQLGEPTYLLVPSRKTAVDQG